MSDTPTAQQVARDEAVKQIVGTLCYMAVVGAVSWALMNRDMLWRAKRAVELRWRNRNADPYAVQIGEFRREINDISRGSSGPDTSRDLGLYERG